ncbi:MAG: TlyA family RNA methyltransferase [Thermodesulfobacteriota bacterium]
MPPVEKKRLDQLLVDKGLALTRQKAQAMIMAGLVRIDDRPADKPGIQVRVDASVTAGDPCPYVSRGGLKLEGALSAFGLDVTGFVCLDVGASTGGFTHCLLSRGASRVYAVDVGYGQLAWELRQDPRVVTIERTNIRHMAPGALPEPVDLVTIDASFISLKIVIPAVLSFMKPDAVILALIKPQFEVGKGQVGKGGVVRDPDQHQAVLDDLTRWAKANGLRCQTAVPSPITGPKGNVEFFNMFGLDFSKKTG